MLNCFTDGAGTVDLEALLRCFGYGVPNFGRLMSSADDSLTLIAQGAIQPFFMERQPGEKKGPIKTREMRLHRLPWPTEVLRDLGNAPVTMRVTLSYFIEPSPGARGWTSKYGRQSCSDFALPSSARLKAWEPSRTESIGTTETTTTKRQALVTPGDGASAFRHGHWQPWAQCILMHGQARLLILPPVSTLLCSPLWDGGTNDLNLAAGRRRLDTHLL